MGDKLICTDCRKKLKNGETLTGCFYSDCIFYFDKKQMEILIEKLFDSKKAIRLVPLTREQIKYLPIFEIMCKYFNCHYESQHGFEIKKFIKDYYTYIKGE